jgi:hypothetical protein
MLTLLSAAAGRERPSYLRLGLSKLEPPNLRLGLTAGLHLICQAKRPDNDAGGRGAGAGAGADQIQGLAAAFLTARTLI